MNAVTHSKGFTLIELTLAMVAGSVLAITAGALLVFLTRETTRSRQMTELQADMRVAVPTVYRLIRESSGGNVTAPLVSQTGTVFTVGTKSVFRANAALTASATGNSLVYDPNTARSGDELVLSRGWVTNFSCVRYTNSLWFSIGLDNGRTTMRVDGTAYYRN